MDSAQSLPPTIPPPNRKNTGKPDRTGQQLGSYRLVRLLGEGGFAEVYLGEHIHLNTYAAIKLLHAQLVTDELEQFRAEARLVARLRHPHIVSVIDFNVEDGTPFLVMDYAPNGNLRQRHPRGTLVSPAAILDYLRQIGSALQHAHDERLIHRDIKPENMLLGGHNQILLSDFGIAVVEQTTRAQLSQDIIGTISYMSPEQLQGKPRLASDQYALGVVVYEWLCGDCPFHGSVAEIIGQHINAAPPSLCERNPDTSPTLEQVVFKALAKNPEDRYPTVLDFVNAFAAANQQHPLLLSEVAPGTNSNNSSPNMHLSATIQAVPSENKAREHVSSIKKNERRISRRTVLFGLTGLTAVGLATGGITWLMQVYIHNKALKPTSIPTPTPTPIPVGTVILAYHGHSDAVNTVAWSSSSGNGSFIASGSKDHQVHVWYSDQGVDVLTYGGHADIVNTVAWSPDGKTIASGSNDKMVLVWNYSDGSSLYSYTNHSDAITTVAWSPGGKRIASGSADKTVQIWDSADGGNGYTYSGHSNGVKALAWSPDGTLIASASADKTVQRWNAADGSSPYTYQGHSDAVNAVAWSPDGTRIASGSADHTVQVWQAATGKLTLTYSGHSDGVNAIAWSPDGTRIASGSADKTVHIWSAADGTDIYSFTAHTDTVNTVTWSPDGTYIASGSADRTVQVWQGV